jgi:hypothetical protein
MNSKWDFRTQYGGEGSYGLTKPSASTKLETQSAPVQVESRNKLVDENSHNMWSSSNHTLLSLDIR